MNIEKETNHRMPAEWMPHEAVWLSWPVRDPRHWGGAKADLMDAKFAEIAAAISRSETVRINANPGEEERIREVCNRARAVPERVEIYEHPHDDVWCRDHGPIFVKHEEFILPMGAQRGHELGQGHGLEAAGKMPAPRGAGVSPAAKNREVSGDIGALAVTDWEFNAWGGKFPPWDLDNGIPKAVAASLGLPVFRGGMILEGGAIEVNSAGQLLTTEAVLLNPNRNPQMGREEIEARLRDVLGMREILWLAQGIEGDDTDGHIDDIARFVDDSTVLACHEPDVRSQNHAVLDENLGRLRGFLDAGGRPFEVVPIHLPEACEVPGWRLPVLPASYVNFLILNEAVLVPTFRQAKNDDRALGMIRELFPGRRVEGIDCLDLVEEGGTLHCISQQQPA